MNKRIERSKSSVMREAASGRATGSERARLFEKLVRLAAERLGDLGKRVNGNRLFSAFNLADVVAGKLGQLGQFFLREASSLTISADLVSERRSMFGGRSHGGYMRRKTYCRLPTIVVFFFLRFFVVTTIVVLRCGSQK